MSEHAHGHHRNYLRIYFILLGLLVVSIVGPMAEIRIVTLITAFGVAIVKAYMVAKNFMHLDVEKPIIQWLLGMGLVLMLILFGGLAPDVMKDKGHRWEKDARFHQSTDPGHHDGAAGHGEKSDHGTSGSGH